MLEEHQIEANRIRARNHYYVKRDIQDKEKLKIFEEEARIRNRDISLMNEVRNIVKGILSR